MIGRFAGSAIMGLISDASSIQIALVVPLICYVYVLYYAIRGYVPVPSHRNYRASELGLSTVK